MREAPIAPRVEKVRQQITAVASTRREAEDLLPSQRQLKPVERQKGADRNRRDPKVGKFESSLESVGRRAELTAGEVDWEAPAAEEDG